MLPPMWISIRRWITRPLSRRLRTGWRQQKDEGIRKSARTVSHLRTFSDYPLHDEFAVVVSSVADPLDSLVVMWKPWRPVKPVEILHHLRHLVSHLPIFWEVLSEVFIFYLFFLIATLAILFFNCIHVVNVFSKISHFGVFSYHILFWPTVNSLTFFFS